MPSTKKCALSLYFCFLLGIHLEIDQKLVRVRYTAFIGCSSRVKAISMNLEEKATLLLTKVVVAGVANEVILTLVLCVTDCAGAGLHSIFGD